VSYIALTNGKTYSLAEVDVEPKYSDEIFVGEEVFLSGLYKVTRTGTLTVNNFNYPLYETELIRTCLPSKTTLRSIPLNLKGEPTWA